MSVHRVRFGSRIIEFTLQFSSRRTLGISVLPDLSVIVTAPHDVSEDLEKIKAKIRKKAAWILRQQNEFGKFLPAQPARRYVSGETHRYLGRQYRLKLAEGTPESVQLKSGYLWVTAENKEHKEGVRCLIERWYWNRAKQFFDKNLEVCAEKFKRYDLPLPPFRLRRMSKRWGTCGATGILHFNPDLIKTPSSCIEYVIVHELCHLIYPFHDRQFYALLQRVMPDWEIRKARLEKLHF